MLLKNLLKNIEILDFIGGNLEDEILCFSCDSRNISFGDVYFCVTENSDIKQLCKEAALRGAKYMVVNKPFKSSSFLIVVKDVREALALSSANFYGKPAKTLKIIGVVGTNGKTTITHMIAHSLKYLGKKVGTIGTLGVYFNDEFRENRLTTPDSKELHKFLREMANEGIEYVVIEVSAHAIYYKKTFGIKFDTLVFTNISQDHLDFFGTIEKYAMAKKSIFDDKNYLQAVINSDDALGIELLKNCKRTISYGIENPADIFAINLKMQDGKTSFISNILDNIFSIKINLIGKYNVSNALACISTLYSLKINPKLIAKSIESFLGVKGRLERIETEKAYEVYIDFAHTPDGLEKVLKTLRQITKNRLICVFGCGGNRDKSKRSIMGEIAETNSDFVVITSDNSRFEDSVSIISDIEKGMHEDKKHVCIKDRKEATKYAISNAQEGDVILFAGKGGEDYQEILGIKHPYNEKNIIMKNIK